MSGEWLRPDWPAPATVRACVTTRAGGVSTGPFAALNLGRATGDAPARVAVNRSRLRDTLGLESIGWLQQVHGIKVHRLGGAASGAAEPPQADASVTEAARVACAVLVADCLPVLFTTRRGERVAAAHAGWRGLAAGVLEATLKALAAPSDEVLAWLGPAIGAEVFEVGDEVRAAFLECAGTQARSAELRRAFSRGRRGRWYADLPRIARIRLAAAGVRWVGGRTPDVYGDPARFYSHRRDSGLTGRQAALVWLERSGN